jgi:uncharacterized UPF0160 family protein
MTNVDLEGFRDWSDKELIEAVNFIKNELNNRQHEKIKKALLQVKEAFNALEKECDIDLYFDEHYNLTDLYHEIEKEVKCVL